MGQSNKGISYVIATVILVAVAVVAAAALAGFSSWIFGEYSKPENQITPYEYGRQNGNCTEKYKDIGSYPITQCIEGKIDRLIEMVNGK